MPQSLLDLCFNELSIPDDVKLILKSSQNNLRIPLNYNNRVTTVEKTIEKIDRLSQCTQINKKRRYVDEIHISTENLHMLVIIQAWILINVFHTNNRNKMAVIGIKYGLITSELCNCSDIAKMLDVVTINKIWPIIKLWPNSLLELSKHNMLCKSAKDCSCDAPCMTIFSKKLLNDWCQYCIYRWAEYEDRREKHEKCCKRFTMDKWCENCIKMKQDINWASLVHLIDVI